jgi:hypothetical protein
LLTVDCFPFCFIFSLQDGNGRTLSQYLNASSITPVRILSMDSSLPQCDRVSILAARKEPNVDVETYFLVEFFILEKRWHLPFDFPLQIIIGERS